ncbi:hypothetical protein [Bifidobacterium breve]|uniref:hypothetical protein n=1 Tax=Bifidobacterium breve TaxID=1685 RepID=UPI00211984E9|nr:hypothetical protein [Bifidobacterium breve]
MPDISGRDGSKPTMLIMDNDRMALMALQSILAKALPDFELLPPVSEGSKAIQLCTPPNARLLCYWPISR